MRMRRKRHIALLLILLLALLLIGAYLAKHDILSAPSTSRSLTKSRLMFPDYQQRVIPTVDHGCYLQSSNFTQHHHSPQQLAERGCQQKLPHVLIVGGALCGTKTFKHALSFHPHVVASEADLPIFHDSEDKDKSRFMGLMPHSLPNQITIGESQEYMYSRNVSKFMLNLLGSRLKVIVLVRDPVARAMSEFLVLTSQSHRVSYRASLSESTKSVAEKNDTFAILNAMADFKKPPEVERVTKKVKRHVEKESRKERYHNRDKRKTKNKSKNKHTRKKRSADVSKVRGSPSNAVKSEEVNYNLRSTFERTILDSKNQIDGTNFLVQRSVYATGIKRWKNLIPRENLLILDAEVFARDPAASMKIAENFLNLKPYFHPDFFDFDLGKGVFCFNALLRSCVQPFSVQRPLPVLADSVVSEFREFLIPWIKVQNRVAGAYFPHLGERPLVFTPFK